MRDALYEDLAQQISCADNACKGIKALLLLRLELVCRRALACVLLRDDIGARLADDLGHGGADILNSFLHHLGRLTSVLSRRLHCFLRALREEFEPFVVVSKL